jgi:hypothetical protein
MPETILGMPKIETTHLVTINLEFETIPSTEPTPYGGRRLVHSGTGSFEGERLKGDVAPGGAFGWTLIRADNAWEINVRAILIPNDDRENVVYASWTGIRDAPQEVVQRLLAAPESVRRNEYYFRITPYFETGSKKYAWINKVCSVGYGEWVTKRKRRLWIFEVK